MSIATPHRREWTIAALLLVASTGHIAAVILPFVAMRTLLSTEIYGLISSVCMLWKFGLYGLALLVVAFSIVFPFAKLLVLWLCWASDAPGPRLRRLLALAESAGKWSMFDIFLIVLLLVVTSGCTLVATKPLVGAVCFLIGVCSTMMGGQLIAGRLNPERAEGASASCMRGHVLMGIAALTLLVAQLAPLMETDSVLVKDRTFSLLEMVWVLLKSGMTITACSVALFLLALPWVALIAQWLTLGGRAGGRCIRVAAGLRHWVMLDVFVLALVLFVVESQSTVPTLPAIGSGVLGAAVLLHALATRMARRQVGL